MLDKRDLENLIIFSQVRIEIISYRFYTRRLAMAPSGAVIWGHRERATFKNGFWSDDENNQARANFRSSEFR